MNSKKLREKKRKSMYYYFPSVLRSKFEKYLDIFRSRNGQTLTIRIPCGQDKLGDFSDPHPSLEKTVFGHSSKCPRFVGPSDLSSCRP